MQEDFYGRALRYSSSQWYNQWPMGMSAGSVGITPFASFSQNNHMDKKETGEHFSFVIVFFFHISISRHLAFLSSNCRHKVTVFFFFPNPLITLPGCTDVRTVSQWKKISENLSNHGRLTMNFFLFLVRLQLVLEAK